MTGDAGHRSPPVEINLTYLNGPDVEALALTDD